MPSDLFVNAEQMNIQQKQKKKPKMIKNKKKKQSMV